jgi:hypothetical protein
VALAVERLPGRDCLRFCFGGMQAVMPRSARAARNGLLSSPRSAISSRAGGSSGTRMFVPFWSFICPAESSMTTGRPWPSQTAASFAFSPPWGCCRGSDPVPPFAEAGRAAVRLELGAVDAQPIRRACFARECCEDPADDAPAA